MPKQTKFIMAFDFGMKCIGCAVGQEETQTTTPLKVLLAKDGIPDWTHISNLINEWQPFALVVGIPLNMDGSRQQLTFSAKKFANRLKERYQLPVYPVDERLSSIAAKQRATEEYDAKQIKSKRLDSVAAQIILETWFSGN